MSASMSELDRFYYANFKYDHAAESPNWKNRTGVRRFNAKFPARESGLLSLPNALGVIASGELTDYPTDLWHRCARSRLTTMEALARAVWRWNSHRNPLHGTLRSGPVDAVADRRTT